MKQLFVVGLLGIACLWAQTPNLSGVWKANTSQSKGLPPQGDYLVIIEQSDSTLTEKIGMYSPRGEVRSSLTHNLSGPEATGTYQGLPIKSKTIWEGGALVVDAKQPGTTIHTKYALSSDGKTLTEESKINSNGREMQRLLVLEKQPDSAGEPLRKPEQTAGERFKNVQMLKTMTASGLFDTMRYFSMSLGTNCEFCHVPNDFASDDKPHKAMARKMMTMTGAINQQNFNGKMAVRCYTCHQGHNEPHLTPAF